MSKPFIHAKSSAKRWGGDMSDYLPIHNMADSTKSVVADARHRVIFHSAFGCFLLEKMFGINFEKLNQLAQKFNWTKEEIDAIIEWKNDCLETGTNIKNSNGNEVSVRDIAEQHCVEDFKGFIPSLQDYIVSMQLEDWMNNGIGVPPSQAKIVKRDKIKLLD